MKKQAFNPYLPSWEYVPDGEPYVFGGRVYVYGSHDMFGGHVFCLNDYVCWSAPVDDLGNWRYEGVIYRRTQDPLNEDGHMALYAPDVTVGPDGRYYLYYVLDKVNVVSVAVCDTPAGKYEFYGFVHYSDGTLLGKKEGDDPQFDPGVITENGVTHLYTGFCPIGDKSRHGPMHTVLGEDMLTIVKGPRFIMPSQPYSAGSGYEGHEFFEASSIRKRNGIYYFIYSSVVLHELCYATSDSPEGEFKYQGVVVSNCDMHIGGYKPADKPVFYTSNNHGSMEEINGNWYIFYHRHTNGTVFSRQGCAEKLTFNEDGSINQAQMTSCGLNDGPLEGKGWYPSYICCNLFTDTELMYTGGSWGNGMFIGSQFPRITQDEADADENTGCGYIANMTNSATAGFKFFGFKNSRVSRISIRGYGNGVFEVRTEIGGEVLGTIPVENFNYWTDVPADIRLPDGTGSIYFTFNGNGSPDFAGFELKED